MPATRARSMHAATVQKLDKLFAPARGVCREQQATVETLDEVNQSSGRVFVARLDFQRRQQPGREIRR